MQKHVKIYLDYFGLGEQDIITCECCQRQGRVDGSGFDIHHIEGRGKGKDVIENLICLCRKHHDMVHRSEISRGEIIYIHNHFLLGHRKNFMK